MKKQFPSSKIFGLIFLFLVPSISILHAQQKRQGAQAVLQSAEKLSLTGDQKGKIQKIISNTIRTYRQVSTDHRGKPDLQRILADIRQKGQGEAILVLTPGQKKIWEQRDSPSQGQSGQEDEILKRSLIIPTISELKNPPSRGAYGPSAELTPTTPHPPLGDAYVILTDHTDLVALGALKQLADFRGGKIFKVDSLGSIYRDREKGRDLRSVLIKEKVKYVAIAPKLDSYRENLHLFILTLLSSLDDDPELDAFPGYLVASDAKSLAGLVERTVSFVPIKEQDIKPVSIGAIEDANTLRYRSYQKAKVIQKMFTDDGSHSPSIIITTKESHTKRDDFPDISGGDNIAMLPGSERHTFEELSNPASAVLNQNNMLFMFGHGTTDRICGTRISAYSKIDFSNEIVFCGSCMSATPYLADRLDLSSKQDNKRFAFHAIDNGAVMLLGHMGLCGGFPKVFPMAELVLEGLSSGEAYQRLMNSLVRKSGIPEYYPDDPPARASQRDPANGLLYVLLGDPALIPLSKSN